MTDVAKLVKKDPHICIREVNARLSLSFGTFQRISTKTLHLQKLTAKWLPHELADGQQCPNVSVSRDLCTVQHGGQTTQDSMMMMKQSFMSSDVG